MWDDRLLQIERLNTEGFFFGGGVCSNICMWCSAYRGVHLSLGRFRIYFASLEILWNYCTKIVKKNYQTTKIWPKKFSKSPEKNPIIWAHSWVHGLQRECVGKGIQSL